MSEGAVNHTKDVLRDLVARTPAPVYKRITYPTATSNDMRRAAVTRALERSMRIPA